MQPAPGSSRPGSRQLAGQPDDGQPVDEPLGRVDVVPPGPVAVVSLKGMMVVVVALPQRDQRHPPTVPARVRLGVGLAPPQMTDGIDAEGGVQDQKDPHDPGQQEAAEPASPSSDKKADHER